MADRVSQRKEMFLVVKKCDSASARPRAMSARSTRALATSIAGFWASASWPTSSMSRARRSASSCIAARLACGSAMTPSCAASIRATMPVTGVRSSWAMSAAVARRSSSSRRSVAASRLKAEPSSAISAPPPRSARTSRSPSPMRSVTVVSRRSGRTRVIDIRPALMSAKPSARPTPRQRAPSRRWSMKRSSWPSVGPGAGTAGPAICSRATRCEARSARLESTARDASQTERSTAAMAISVIAMVTRAPTLSRDMSGTLDSEAVAHAVHRLDVARRRRVGLDLAAEVLDVRVHRALVALVVVALDSVDQLEARVHAPGRLGQRDEQAPLRRGQVHALGVDRHLVAVEIEAQAPAVEAARRARVRLDALGAAQQRAHAGDELARAEGLGHVVVGAEVQAADALVLAGAGAQHEDRDGRLGADRRADLLAGQVGEHPVEHDQGRAHVARHRETVAPADRGEHLVALTLQVAAGDIVDRGLVVDNQDAFRHHTANIVQVQVAGEGGNCAPGLRELAGVQRSSSRSRRICTA